MIRLVPQEQVVESTAHCLSPKSSSLLPLMILQETTRWALSGTTSFAISLHSPAQVVQHVALGCGCLASISLFYVFSTSESKKV